MKYQNWLKQNAFSLMLICLCIIIEYIGIWEHNRMLIFVGGIIGLTNILMLTKKDI